MLLPLVVVAIAAMPWVIFLTGPGFGVKIRATTARSSSAHHLRYILFISLTALYGGVLNSLGRFAAAAAAR